MFFVTLKKYRAAVAQLATLSDQLREKSEHLTKAIAIADDLLDGVRARDFRIKTLDAEAALMRHELFRNTLELQSARNSAMSAGRGKNPFDDTKLRALLQLCHPDKHGGKQSAVEMTAYINSLRK